MVRRPFRRVGSSLLLVCTTTGVVALAEPARAQDDPAQEFGDPWAGGDEEEAKKDKAPAVEPPPTPLAETKNLEGAVIPAGRRLPYYPVNAGLVYPAAINAGAPDAYTHFDLALILSSVGVVYGVQVGALGWIVYDLRGIQIDVAGVVGGKAEGLMLGGVFAMADGRVEGLQAAGIFDWASDVDGVQLAAVGTHTARDLNGLQAAGLFNVLRRDLEGIQVAGAVNVGRVDGFQLAPINISQRARGLQVGVFNIAREIDGLQVGVVNVTDNLDGESLGIIPLPRKGGIHLALWGSNSLLGNVGIKFASRYAYSLLSAGIGNEEDEAGEKESVYAGGLTMGASLPLGSGFRAASDLGVYRRFRDEFTFDGQDQLYKLRVIGAFSIARRMTPFLGGGMFVSVHDLSDGTTDSEAGPEFFLGVEL